MEYRARTLDRVLDELMPTVSAISIDGPKAVGKSGTALRRAQHSWFLDDPGQLGQLEADPTFASAPAGTLLIDEWQIHPPIWDSVRRRVDEGAPGGRFLLTGSASLTTAGGTHSGAGRILSLRMRPMAIHERGAVSPTVSLTNLVDGGAEISGQTSWVLKDYVQAITASGLPGLLGAPERVAGRQVRSYLERVVDRDIPELGGSIRRPATFRRWISAYAAASSTTTSHAKIIDAVGDGDGNTPAKSTTLAYRDHLTTLWLLDEVPAWEPNRVSLGRLAARAKHQLADPAFAASVLGLTTASLLSARGSHMVGPLFESLATLSVRVAALAIDAEVGHIRTGRGEHEIDLVAEGPDGRLIAFEVKLAAAVKDEDVRHLLWLREKLGEDIADLVVLTTGDRAYRRRDGVAVVPLSLLGP